MTALDLATVTGGNQTVGQIIGGPVGPLIDRALGLRLDGDPRKPPQGEGIPLPTTPRTPNR